MPAKSAAQKRLMDAAAHNPAFAKKVGIPTSVATEFSEASKGKKFGKGGMESRPDLQKVAKPKTDHGKTSLFNKGGKIMASDKLKKLFKGKESMKEEMAEAKAIKSGKITPMEYAKGEKMEGHRKGGAVKCMAKGGYVRAADGVAQRGKTKGKIC